MLENAKRSIGFFCPKCRQAVLIEKSAFELAAASSALSCPCGGSQVQTQLAEQQVQLTVPCLFCEGEHSFTCSTRGFLKEKIMAFSCGLSGLDCCYIGEEAAVYGAMNRLQETVDAMEAQAGQVGMFLNDMVMEEILAELRDIGQREGGISCTCGSREVSLHINYSSVEIVCAKCGGELKVPAATLSDLDDLCCKPTLSIRGKEKL